MVPIEKLIDLLVEEVLTKEHEFNYLHDIVVEATGKSIDRDDVSDILFKIDDYDLICDAIKWGFGDTEVRDKLYSFLK